MGPLNMGANMGNLYHPFLSTTKARIAKPSFLELSYNLATFVTWIVYKNEKYKIVSPPILSNVPKIAVFCTKIGEN